MTDEPPPPSWQYEASPDITKTLAERLHNFPREPDMLIYGLRSISAILLRIWLRTYHRLDVEGLERIPQEESYILVANHSSHLDALSLLSMVPLRRLHRAFPAAAADYFFANLPRTAFSAIFINAVPFGRFSHMRESLQVCKELLANRGNILIIFPEGTRSATGVMGDFKPGIGLLVAGTSLPIIPCYIEGAARAWPKGSLFPRPHRIKVNIGNLQRFADLPPGKESALEIAKRLRAELVRLGAPASAEA